MAICRTMALQKEVVLSTSATRRLKPNQQVCHSSIRAAQMGSGVMATIPYNVKVRAVVNEPQ